MRSFLPVEGINSPDFWADSRYAIGGKLYSLIGTYFANLTSAPLIRSNRTHAQVAELVDALASGASGLTAVKVRVLSWAPPPHFQRWLGQHFAHEALMAG